MDKAHFIRSGNECEQTEDSEARSQQTEDSEARSQQTEDNEARSQ